MTLVAGTCSEVMLVSENDLFLTLGLGTSNARNENLRPLLNTNIPLISGNYGLRNHFWPLESRFLMRKNEKKSIFSKPPNLPILSFWILNLHIIICQFQKNPPRNIFVSHCIFLPLVWCQYPYFIHKKWKLSRWFEIWWLMLIQCWQGDFVYYCMTHSPTIFIEGICWVIKMIDI